MGYTVSVRPAWATKRPCLKTTAATEKKKKKSKLQNKIKHLGASEMAQ